jgi:DNA gyrase subunit A
MDLEPGDELVFARLAREDDDVVMVSARGKAIRFTAAELRSASRASGGVRGMRLVEADDEVVAMEVVVPGAMLLTLSETGLGKRTEFDEYPRHARGGQGVVTHNVTARTGRVVAARAVTDDLELMTVSQSGIVMRCSVDSIAKVGRSAQGVHVMNVGAGDRLATVALIDMTKGSGDPTASRADGGAEDNGDTNGSGNGRTPRRGNGRRPANNS